MRSGGEHDCAGVDVFGSVDVDDVAAMLSAEALYLGGQDDARPELRGLKRCAFSKLSTGDARWEAEVVLDAWGRSGLTTGGDAIEDHRFQALRCAVHRGCQTGRPGADHDEIGEVCQRDRRGRSPSSRASSALLGLRSTLQPCQMTSGVCFSVTPSCASS